MEPSQDRSLVPTPSRELIAVTGRTNRVLGEMVERSLALANQVAAAEIDPEALVREARRIQGTSAGMTPENIQAFNLFLRAAKAGHSEAQYEVGFCFAFASGVRYDSVESRHWIGLAAKNGFAPAQNKVANGLSHEGKFGEAAEWYSKAAEQGHPASQISLSDYYWDGKGVSEDYCQAYAWARLAADADEVADRASGDPWCGPEGSLEQAEAFAATLSPKQLDQARELYLAFKRKYSPKRRLHGSQT